MPLLKTNGGGGVALAKRAAARNAAVDCNAQNIFQTNQISMMSTN